MTTTDVYQGMAEEGKPSSRVLRPPGGGQSFSLFGGEDPAPAPAAPSPKKAAASSTTTTAAVPHGDAAGAPTVSKDRLFDQSGSMKPVNPMGNIKNKGFNPITGMGDESSMDPSQSAAPVMRQRVRGGRINTITGESYGEGDKENEAGGGAAARGGFNPITGQPYGDVKEGNQQAAAKTRGTYNPITCEDYGPVKTCEFVPDPEPPAKPVHTSTRVRQPPGGASTPLW